MSQRATMLPGFEAPAVGFDQPFEMLRACHDRVERSLSLLGRLVAHVQAHGHDEASRSAARDVLRYFDLAAPLHHQDEEIHVLPPLLAEGGVEQRDLAALVIAEHRTMEQLWAELRVPLQAWAALPAPVSRDFPLPAVHHEFVALYAGHIEREESQVYPRVQDQLDPAALRDMETEMTARRRTATPAVSG